MAGYKDAEIEAAVSRFVRSTIRIEKDALGPVVEGTKFDEVIQLLSSTLTYDPNAIFYVIFLATNKLNANVELAVEYAEDIDEAIDEMGNYTEDVTRTTLLGDAAAALLTVDQILSDKSAISSTAFTRYQQAVDEFTAVSLEPNIKQSAQIVRPPQLAREVVQSTINSLSTTYSEILTTLAQVRLMLSEFNSLNLGVLSIQNSVQKVRDDLRTLQAQFEDTSTTRDDKIALCRDAYLSIAAGKSVLNNFTTVSDPSEPRLISSSSVIGRPEIPAGEDGELVSATTTCTNSAPWEITASADQLEVTPDGGAEETYTFTPPDQPSILSAYSDSFDADGDDVAYDIQDGVTDTLGIDGLPDIDIPDGSSQSASAIAAVVDAWAAAGPYPYEAVDEDYGGQDFLRITKTTPGATEIRVTSGNDALGFYEGQSDSSDGLTASEAVALIGIDELTPSVERTLYESGEGDGHIEDETNMRLALNTLSSTDHTGDMLLVRSGTNVGYRRIVSVQRGVDYDEITVSSDTPFKETGLDESWLVLSDKLRLTSKAADLTTSIEIGDGDINSVLGFVDDTLVVGTTTGFCVAENGTDVDFSQSDVAVGDIVRIVGTYPGAASAVSSEHTVVELSASNRQLEISPPIRTDLTVESFRILSAAAVAYEGLVSSLEEWDEALATSDFQEDILELERVMNPLIANKNPSAAALQDAKNTLQGLTDLLTNSSPAGLTEILEAYWVRLVPRIDAALKMLKERGMDRAYGLLMDGKIEEFFSMDKDDTSSSAYMLKSMRSAVQSDLRTSKLDEDADDIIHDDLIVGTDPDYDFSDADPDENVRILGDVPDFDDDADSEITSKVRY